MIKKSKLFKYLYENDPELYGNLGYRAIKIYQARYGTRTVADLIRAYGGNIFKSHWVDRYGREHYGLPKAVDLIRSHYHMAKIQNKQIQRINEYSLYTTRKGQQNHEARHVGFYTALVSGAVDKVSRHGVWIDSINRKPVYKLLNKFHNKLSRQIRSNKRFRHVILLASDTENPAHFDKSLYSHGHNHGLLGITGHDRAVVAELNRAIRNDFKAVFGYPLVKPSRNNQKLAPVQPLTYTTGHGVRQRSHHAVISTKHGSSKANHLSMDAVDKFTKYMDSDYHIQTKDIDFSSFLKAPLNERHKAVCAQLNSTKGMSLNHGISQRTADEAKAGYDNYKHFVATDRWASHRKHLTSIEQWTKAQGRSVSTSKPATEQTSLDLSEPAVNRQPDSGTLIIALRAVLSELLISIHKSIKNRLEATSQKLNQTYIRTEDGDRLTHSGVPP